MGGEPGREKEIAEVKRLIERTRLLTLTGSGGTGKSRLAVQVAAELLPGQRDGVWLVELAPLTDPALVPQAVATVLGVREQPGQPLLQALVEALRPKRLLLLLDNCEHLLAACAGLADALLRGCPGVQILASSREGLGIAGEQTYSVPSLSAPDPRQPPATLEEIERYEAVRLFIDRAVMSQPSFTVTADAAPAVAEICHRLDGIPLAVELAAARLWGAATASRALIGGSLPPLERAGYKPDMAAAQAALGEEAFRAAWAEGQSMAPEEAVAYARA